MQRGDERRPLDRKLERALLEQLARMASIPSRSQILPNSSRSANPFGRDRQRAFVVLVERVDQQDLIGELGA